MKRESTRWYGGTESQDWWEPSPYASAEWASELLGETNRSWFGVVWTGVATVIRVKGIRWVYNDPGVLEKSEAGFRTCRIIGGFFFLRIACSLPNRGGTTG